MPFKRFNYKIPVDEFATRMFISLVECAQKVSERKFSDGKEKLQVFNEQCKGLFNSVLLSSDDTVEHNMEKFFKKVEEFYVAGCYGNEGTVNDFVNEALLEQFCLEYDTLLENLGLACRVMQLVDTSVSNTFFDKGLILKDFETIKLSISSSKKIFPDFVLCAKKTSEEDFDDAASILFSLELKCQIFLQSAWISSVENIADHLKSQFDAVQKDFNTKIYSHGWTVEGAVEEVMMREFRFEYGSLLEILKRSCELFLTMDSVGFCKFFYRSSEGLKMRTIYDENITQTFDF